MLGPLVRRAAVYATALGVVAALAACSAPSEPSRSASPTWPRQALDWRGCGHGESFQAGTAVTGAPECALLRLPTDYRHPEGGTQDLAVTRISATGTRKGVLFFNPGGPGVSATDMLARLAQALPPRVRAAYDLVGMDPRAVGESGYLSCTDPEARTRTAPLDLTPDTAAERDALAASLARLGASCQQRQPSLIGHLGTDDFARDVETLRLALGVDQFDLFGASYGTLVAYEYARLYPGRVHRMVLDGVVVPGESAATSALARADASEQALFDFADACASEGCELGATAQQVLSRIHALQRTLERRPVPVHGQPARDAIDEGLFTAVLHEALYSDASAFDLPRAVVSLEKSDPAPFLALSEQLEPGPHGGTNNVVSGTYWATTCTDQPRVEITDRQRADIAAASDTFGRLLVASASACQSWPMPAAPLTGTTLKRSTGLKAMLITNTDDPATPRSGANEVAALLPGSATLDVDIWGHTAAMNGLECVDLAVADFLLEGKRPPAAGCSAP